MIVRGNPSIYIKYEYEAEQFCISNIHIEVCYTKPLKLIKVGVAEWKEVIK